METKSPTLRRPKRKLCYFTSNESPPKLTEPLTMADIDKLFDDLDASSHDNADPSSPSPLLQTFDIEKTASPVPQERLPVQLTSCQMDIKGNLLRPATRSPSPKLDIDLDIPFTAHMPVKTSSPIVENMVVEVPDSEKDQIVSPLLFACEDDGKEEAMAEHLLIQKPKCNGHVTEGNDDSQLESPPSKVVFGKPKMSSHKNKVEGLSKESHPVKENTPKKPQTSVLEDKRKTPRHENADLPVSAVRQEPEVAANKICETIHREPAVESTCATKDMTAFLKKLRGDGQPKPTCSRKSLSPVKVSTPPLEPEDDFLILEDDKPLWFSIPSKTATSKKLRQSRTSSSDKDSSTDKNRKDSALETAQQQQESEQTKRKLGSETVSQKTKKTKGKEKKNEVTASANDKNELSSPEDPASDVMKQEKTNKKKQRLKMVPSNESDKEEENPKEGTSGETHEERPTLETEKKALGPSDITRSKSLKAGNENAKTSRAKSLKGGRKVTQGCDAVKQATNVKAAKEQGQSSEEPADPEELASLSDKEMMNFEAQTEKDLADEKDKPNKRPAGSEGSSSEDGQILGKRKRRQPGQWWLGHQTSEETKLPDNQPTVKKSKQHNQEPSAAAVPSPVKTKKDRVLKKRNQTELAPPSSQNRNKSKEKKTKQNKNTSTKGGKRSGGALHTIEAEQCVEREQQERQESAVQDLDGHSPLIQRGHSFKSGDQIFQRVYHHVSHENVSATPAPGSLREQLMAAEPRRRRKPPGNWWMVSDICEEVESISSQQKPKPHKERNKLSQRSRSPRLGTPKSGNVAVSTKPLEGAPVPLLKTPPLSAPKTVKRSLATFKDIFTSAIETAPVVSRRGAGQKKTPKVTACPIFSETEGGIHNTEDGEPRSTEDSRCRSEDRLKVFRSGPSSMIELEEVEEDEDLILTPPRVHAALSVADLCAPPLRPLVLQSKDKVNLTEWFKSLWSSSDDKGAEVSPDQFDWYFYQGRAIGLLVDLNCETFCNGKILLGSYMKKPLWVDHSATTVFNLLTSSVCVTINGKESRFHPGQSFMVPCGHAYSLQNITAQPAVLYFTRIVAESSA